ncbi:hypothetical protein BDV93DRAFT_580764 [Ceratobasidium sp. AG-I]|nr:hypothetical protein BDV93DRAFT_580764 [Ceratobasidium sp. AG-I]
MAPRTRNKKIPGRFKPYSSPHKSISSDNVTSSPSSPSKTPVSSTSMVSTSPTSSGSTSPLKTHECFPHLASSCDLPTGTRINGSPPVLPSSAPLDSDKSNLAERAESLRQITAACADIELFLDVMKKEYTWIPDLACITDLDIETMAKNPKYQRNLKEVAQVCLETQVFTKRLYAEYPRFVETLKDMNMGTGPTPFSTQRASGSTNIPDHTRGNQDDASTETVQNAADDVHGASNDSPSTPGDVPYPSDDMTQAIDDEPQAEDEEPQAKNNTAQAEYDVPPATADAPPTAGDVPLATDGTPPAADNILEAAGDVSNAPDETVCSSDTHDYFGDAEPEGSPWPGAGRADQGSNVAEEQEDEVMAQLQYPPDDEDSQSMDCKLDSDIQEMSREELLRKLLHRTSERYYEWAGDTPIDCEEWAREAEKKGVRFFKAIATTDTRTVYLHPDFVVEKNKWLYVPAGFPLREPNKCTIGDIAFSPLEVFARTGTLPTPGSKVYLTPFVYWVCCPDSDFPIKNSWVEYTLGQGHPLDPKFVLQHFPHQIPFWVYHSKAKGKAVDHKSTDGDSGSTESEGDDMVGKERLTTVAIGQRSSRVLGPGGSKVLFRCF